MLGNVAWLFSHLHCSPSYNRVRRGMLLPGDNQIVPSVCYSEKSNISPDAYIHKNVSGVYAQERTASLNSGRLSTTGHVSCFLQAYKAPG